MAPEAEELARERARLEEAAARNAELEARARAAARRLRAPPSLSAAVAYSIGVAPA